MLQTWHVALSAITSKSFSTKECFGWLKCSSVELIFVDIDMGLLLQGASNEMLLEHLQGAL